MQNFQKTSIEIYGELWYSNSTRRNCSVGAGEAPKTQRGSSDGSLCKNYLSILYLANES